MRTTIDLPEDLHHQARAIARDKRWTLSQAVAWLMRRGLKTEDPSDEIRTDPLTGFPLISVGRVITSEDVKALEDDE
jgi:predicted transcriptional regulator